MGRIKLIIVFILINYMFISCQTSISVPNLSNKDILLYVEDLDGKGGNYAGGFGDIVIYDMDLNKQYLVTNDNSFDYSPIYCEKLDRIYFESKRGPGHSLGGLTATSHIYYWDIKSKKLELVDDAKFHKKYSGLISDDVSDPLIDRNCVKLFFQGSKPGDYRYNSLYLYKEGLDSLEIIYSYIGLSTNILFNQDNNSVYFDTRTPLKLTNKTKSINRISNLDSNNVDIILSRDNSSYVLCDTKFNLIIYTEVNYNKNEKRTLKIYDEKRDSIIFNKTFNEIGFHLIKSPVFKNDSTIFFIGKLEHGDSVSSEDIYQYYFQTNTLTQITHTHNIKDKLKYYGLK